MRKGRASVQAEDSQVEEEVKNYFGRVVTEEGFITQLRVICRGEGFRDPFVRVLWV